EYLSFIIRHILKYYIPWTTPSFSVSFSCTTNDKSLTLLVNCFVFTWGCFGQIILFYPTDDTSITARLRTRSEEHTSELQSRFDLVCRLLLEKKKQEMLRSRDR